MKRRLLLIAILGSSSSLFGQTVCTGTTQECIEAQQKLCASEPAPANFELLKDRVVAGAIHDQTSAKLDGLVEVQLRVPDKARFFGRLLQSGRNLARVR